MKPDHRPPAVRLTSTAGVVVTLTPEGIGWAEKDGDGAMRFASTVVGGLRDVFGLRSGGTQVLGLDGSVLGSIRGSYGGWLATWVVELPLVVATYLPERYVMTETGAVGGLPACILRGAATERERS